MFDFATMEAVRSLSLAGVAAEAEDSSRAGASWRGMGANGTWDWE